MAVASVERRSSRAHQDRHQRPAACLQRDHPRRLSAESGASTHAARMKLARQSENKRNDEVPELVDEDGHWRQKERQERQLTYSAPSTTPLGHTTLPARSTCMATVL